jgi:toxin ParE1/3/4
MTIYRISPSATQDLKHIADYFFTRNIEAGEALFQEFDLKCRNLVNFPKIGRSYRYLCSGLRGLPLRGYIILYQVKGGTIEILRVVSGNRDLEALFNDEEAE